MKKVFLFLLSVMAVALTSCKTDNATVTVSVMDTADEPVAKRVVFYTDKASAILESVLPPSPEALIGLEDSSWEYAETNNQGTVTFKILMSVASAKYYFLVFDDGTKKFVDKEVTLERGKNKDVEFVVNK
ncbi:MAG: hypothetical protein IKT19_03775 [Paludibacteraceae bacterium]|nr:hypothetical protein [Paludibacteraceae bacterium]